MVLLTATRKLPLWALNWATCIADLPFPLRDQVFLSVMLECSKPSKGLHASSNQLIEVWEQTEQDLRRSSGGRSLRLCANLIRSLFALISRNVSGFVFSNHMSPRPLDSEPEATSHRHEALSQDWPNAGLFPIECLHAAWIAPPTPPWPRASESSAAQVWAAALSFSCLTLNRSSLTECRTVAKLLRSVHPLLTWNVSSASHFPLEVEAHCKQHLGPSQHHQWTKMGLLIYSKSHNQNAQRELGKNSGPGYCLSLILFRNLPPFSLCFLNEILLRLFMKGVFLGQEGGSGLYGSLELLLILTFSLAIFRQRICQYLGLYKFYSWYLFVSSLCLGM